MSSSDIDTRSKNTYFDSSNLGVYVSQYAESLKTALAQVDTKALEKALLMLEETRAAKKTIWVAGNGGSHAIADHLCCDWTKGLESNNQPSLKVHSLGSNGALTSALANDYSYDRVFSEQVRMFGAPGDLVILISSSGNSPNVVKAAEIAREKEIKSIGLTGFSGGTLAEISDVNLHIPFANYGIVEDAHQSLMHILAQYSYLKNRG